jgi:uncharacterized membrane protein YdjX (TVP38/TMEM64 family)
MDSSSPHRPDSSHQSNPPSSLSSNSIDRALSMHEISLSQDEKKSRQNQFRAALIVELSILVAIVSFVWAFWSIWCPLGLSNCVGETKLAPAHFLFLSVLRPFIFTPHSFGTYLAAHSFSEGHAILLSLLASILSAATVYGSTYLIGKNMVIPWMTHNLPKTLRFIRTQDYKLVLAARLIPFFPYDIVSALAGVFNLRFKRFLVYTAIGILPECVFLTFMASPKVSFHGFTFNLIALVAFTILTPLIYFEWQSRKAGKSMLSTLKAAYQEILLEAKINNQIVKRNKIDPTKTPVLLLYGFFSSRRTLNVLERQLVSAGYDVLSFDLGGMFGTFFTHGIEESAAYIDYKIKRQMERHSFKKVKIVAHSKGTLVAYWWLLKMGGSRYCDRVVAMASPCSGSYYVYLALVTPLAFFWRDMWQMRPGSSFLRGLAQCSLPENLKIWAMYSDNDHIARGELGIIKPVSGAEQIQRIPFHECSHFDFIMRRSSINEVIRILAADDQAHQNLPKSTELSEEVGTSLSDLVGGD